MRVSSLKRGGRDGTLVFVSADGRKALVELEGIRTLQQALDGWADSVEGLREAYRLFADGESGEPLDIDDLHSPLPRAYQWSECSTYLPHMERMRAGRGMGLPPEHREEPIAYQSGADRNLAPTEPIPLPEEAWGLDLEATLSVITDDVPVGTSRAEAPGHVLFVLLTNDLTYRHLMPLEYAKGIGPYLAKPARAYAPIACAPEALGDLWDGHKLRATVKSWVNGELLGAVKADVDNAFDFGDVIAYLTRTRGLAAGSIVGTGTVANVDAARGFGCLGEKRAVEQVEHGHPLTPLLKVGDRIRIEAFDDAERSLFGAIDQVVVAPTG